MKKGYKFIGDKYKSNYTKERNKKVSITLTGRKLSKEHKSKISAYKRTEEHKRKTSLALKGYHPVNEFKKGHKHSEKTKEKIVETKKRNNSCRHSEETKKKMSLAKKGKPSNRKGMCHSEESKLKIGEKARIASFARAKRTGIFYPCIGRNEKEILDQLEIEKQNNILRQYYVKGYFVDGYIAELNLVIEVDEIPKISAKDIKRQRIIEEELKCKFIRIEDY